MVYLVEVKYRKNYQASEILYIAKEMKELWDPASIFLATPIGFFFDFAENIIKNKGKIKPLKHLNIPKNLQEKYLQLLNDFER